MIPYAKGEEDGPTYIESENIVIVGSMTSIALTLILFVSIWMYACIRSCCKTCKIDYSRTDYRK
jgi:hypothetical protein